MGYSSWSDKDWKGYSATASTKSADQIFTSKKMDTKLDPVAITQRESRDSDAHPNSTALVISVDVTGSMGILAENLIKTGIGVVFGEILARKPVSDPQLLIMANGDAYTDRSPLQVTQFETDLKITEQLEKVHVEGGGGGNGFESYELPYYFAAYKTSIDCMEKRGKKGYFFTIGDEPPSPGVKRDQIKAILGDTLEADMSFEDVIAAASRLYHCFHIIIAQGSHPKYHGIDSVVRPWRALLGERAVVLEDINALSETVVSIIQVNEGASIDAVASSWSGDKSVAIKSAIQGLSTTTAAGKGVATL